MVEAPHTDDIVEVRIFSTSLISTQNLIADADNDTRIRVEASTDEDTIRFATAGTEVATMTTGATVFANAVQLASMTTTQRNSLSAANGMIIYNTTDNKFQGYENGSWADLI